MKKLSYLILLFIFSLSLAKAQPGSIDWSFKPDFDFQTFRAWDGIFSVANQTDGKTIIGGSFGVQFVNGDTLENILRYNADGTLDRTFKVGTGFNNSVFSVITKAEKIYVGGYFSKLNNISCGNIVRLNSDGIIDSSFKSYYANNFVSNIALQTEGKIIVASSTDFGLSRLNGDGSFDNDYRQNTVDNSFDLFIQKDNKLIIGGYFTECLGYNRKFIARFENNGWLDLEFNPSLNLGLTEGWVSSVINQLDGKILIGGNFKSNKINQINDIVRINENGTLDTSFHYGIGFNSQEFNFINTIFVQKDGKIILGGKFSSFNGKEFNNIVRLNSDGTLDTTFKVGFGANAKITCIAPCKGDKIIVAGDFTSFDNYLFSRIVRLNLENDSINKNSELIFSISPNPSSGIFKINSSQSLKQITITDAIGKEILRTAPMAFDTEIDLSEKSPGLYFVTVYSDSGSKCQKILKH